MSVSQSWVPAVGKIVHCFQVPVCRVEHVARSRNIRPIHRAGIARVFAEPDVARIGAEPGRIRQEKGGCRE